ncbi:MAG: hypothetical protein NT070_07730 [Cyanobacteria bacterium]|nr:hypothetical protein [Cyanobacteriota bacterium]
MNKLQVENLWVGNGNDKRITYNPLHQRRNIFLAKLERITDRIL